MVFRIQRRTWEIAALSIAALSAAVWPTGCDSPGEPTAKGGSVVADDSPESAGRAAADAIPAVFDRDNRVGRIRNDEPRTIPIQTAVIHYVAALDEIDFSECPEEFTEAFRAHREAWKSSEEFFGRFPDLRGEMHDVFEEIRARDDATREELERHEEAIWGTWAEVESAAERYGVRFE